MGAAVRWEEAVWGTSHRANPVVLTDWEIRRRSVARRFPPAGVVRTTPRPASAAAGLLDVPWNLFGPINETRSFAEGVGSDKVSAQGTPLVHEGKRTQGHERLDLGHAGEVVSRRRSMFVVLNLD